MNGRRPQPVGAVLFWICSVLALMWALALAWLGPGKAVIHDVNAALTVLTSVVFATGGALLYALYLIRLELWTARNRPAPSPAAPPPEPVAGEPSPMRSRRARVDEDDDPPSPAHA